MKSLILIPIRYGLIGSIFGVSLILILFYSGTHPLLVPIFFDYRILLFGIFIFFCAKEFREFYNQEILQFWQGMVMGTIIYLIIGLIAGTFIIFFLTVEPKLYYEYVENMIKNLELNKEELLNQGPITMTEEEYELQIKMLRTTPTYYLGIDYFLKSCLLGFLISIIISVVLRRSEARFVDQ